MKDCTCQVGSVEILTTVMVLLEWTAFQSNCIVAKVEPTSNFIIASVPEELLRNCFLI